MPVGLLFDGTGVSEEQYYQVFNQVMHNGQRRPPGLLRHHAGVTDDGVCVIETWESQEALQQFFETELGAALQAANIHVQPKTFPISNAV